MAYSVSQDYKNLIASGAEQRILLLFPDAYFTNAQVAESGVVFSDYFTVDDNLTFGDCPSSAISFSLISNGTLSGYNFGRMSAWIGVQTGTDPYTFGSQKAHIEVGAHTYDCGTDGVFIDETRLVSGSFLSLVSDTEYVYAIGKSSSIRIKTADLTWSVYVPNRIMATRLQTPTSAVFEASTGTLYNWTGTELQTWEYCPMGCYIINRPRKTTDAVVNIQDGHDYMSLFDVDSAEFISGLTYPITLGQIYVALCNYIGVGYVSAVFTNSDVNYTASPFTSNASSCRDVLGWIAGKALSVAHFNRVGQLELRWLSADSVESITTDNLALNECDFAEYEVAPITGVLLKGSNGTSLTFGEKDNLYPVYGNPFISTITNTELAEYTSIPSYKPMEMRLINADPSVDCGDLVDVEPENGQVVLTNQYGEVYAVPVGDPEFHLYTNPDGSVLIKDDGTNTAIGHMAQQYEVLYVLDLPQKLPLMHRELTFIGKCTAVYEATGDRVREIDTSYTTEYNANVAPVTQMDVFNRLTNGGEQQGIYIEDGKIYINAEYIKSGTIDANLVLAGSVTATDLQINGGKIDISRVGSQYEDEAYVHGKVTIGDYMTETSVSPTAFSVYADHSTLSYSQQGVYGSGVMSVSTVNSGTTVSAVVGSGTNGMFSIMIGGITRMSLDPIYGLRFYNASGTMIKQYPVS